MNINHVKSKFQLSSSGSLAVRFQSAIPSVSAQATMEADVCNDSVTSPGTEPTDSPTPPPHTMEPEKQFIMAYEALPQLWDTSDFRYSNRFERFKALGKLLPIYKKVKPYATIEDIKKKINSLRSNFRRELKKFIASERSGAGQSEVYYPKVWYFPYLHFLRKLEHPDNQLLVDSLNATPKPEAPSSPKKIKLERTVISSETKVRTLPPLKRKIVRDNIRTGQYYSQPYQHQCQRISNPLALEWTNTLERLDPMQRLYAKKAINDVLFEAELGTLHKHSVRINESNSYYLSPPSPANESSAQSPHPQPSLVQQTDPISINHKDDSMQCNDIDYKISIPFCNYGSDSQEPDSDTTKQE